MILADNAKTHKINSAFPKIGRLFFCILIRTGFSLTEFELPQALSHNLTKKSNRFSTFATIACKNIHVDREKEQTKIIHANHRKLFIKTTQYLWNRCQSQIFCEAGF